MKPMARLITLLLFGALTLLWAPVASGTELHIPEITARSGQSVDIPIMIDQVDNLAGLKLVIKYDPKILTFKKGVKTKHSDSLMHIINDKKPGRLIVVMAGAKGIRGKDFPILNLTFKIKAGLKGNHVINIEISDLEMMSDQLKDITCRVKVNPLIISGESPEIKTKSEKANHENTKTGKHEKVKDRSLTTDH